MKITIRKIANKLLQNWNNFNVSLENATNVISHLRKCAGLFFAIRKVKCQQNAQNTISIISNTRLTFAMSNQNHIEKKKLSLNLHFNKFPLKM